jgi:hypothetical protein
MKILVFAIFLILVILVIGICHCLQSFFTDLLSFVRCLYCFGRVEQIFWV